ncbi:hypothetical protein HPB50_008100 [Hyalomma asiaticum]|uniref:Uncharacterized protein n=1 Tax=Hyalomma asiaticum TaxID=266040 RepID=A0ACB7S808_HYAAI|nr:hypothetical protein HPB50_008100 [Hyalomma asiaticum]
MSVMGRGKVQIQLSEECGGAHVALEDVLYVPDLNGNLLSVGRIQECGFHVMFAEGKAEVMKDTEDYSRYTVVYPMKAKNEVLQNFDKYRRLVENIHNTKVKTLRSDNGGEYVSKEFKMYLANHGIKHQLTVPGTPEQNGVAERMNQTLLDMKRCLLNESGVTKELWADAVVTASYIRNKCPSKAVGGESPEALWTGGEVKLNHECSGAKHGACETDHARETS